MSICWEQVQHSQLSFAGPAVNGSVERNTFHGWLPGLC